MPQINIPKFQALLKEKGLNHTILAGRMGIDRSTISSWVAGRTIPTDENFDKLVEELKVEPEELIQTHPNGLYIQSPNNHIDYIINYHISISNIILPPDKETFDTLMEKLLQKRQVDKEL